MSPQCEAHPLSIVKAVVFKARFALVYPVQPVVLEVHTDSCRMVHI